MLLFNGRIYGMEDDPAPRDWLAIDGGRIIETGHKDSRPAPYSVAVHLDLGGRTIIPGLIDAHIHFDRFAFSLLRVDCSQPSLAQCLEAVESAARQQPAGTWILGHGWNQNIWERYGTAADLDAVAPEHPVYLTAQSLHASWANSLALQHAGITATLRDPPGGVIQRLANGRPSGIMFEGAVQLIESQIPAPSDADRARALLMGQEALWEFGITGIHDFDGPECFRALQSLRRQGTLGLRVVKHVLVEEMPAMLELGLQSGFGDDWLRIGHIKVFADGALGTRTAAMMAPYDGEPENTGQATHDSETLFELFKRGARRGLAFAVHAIGDRANHEVLDAYQQLRLFESEDGLPHARHRIEHLQLLHPADLARPAHLGIVASMQPIHATSDMVMAERYWGDRCEQAYAWSSVAQAGAVLAFGSDAPVESANPFWGLHAAATRRRQDGSPGQAGWIAAQRLSLTQALRAYTYGPAFAAGCEARLGRLAPGYLADLVALEVDPFTCDPMALAELKPCGTMVAGEWKMRRF
jgi:predicted amidohydrolase YtcJ